MAEKSLRGFAAMDSERQRQIASLGGRSVLPVQRSFSQNPELARAAGRKGGKAVKAENRSFSRDRKLAAHAGSLGGQRVPPEKRSFSDPAVAKRAGAKGGAARRQMG